MKDIDTERSGFAGRRRPACGKIRHLSTVDRNSLPP